MWKNPERWVPKFITDPEGYEADLAVKAAIRQYLGFEQEAEEPMPSIYHLEDIVNEAEAEAQVAYEKQFEYFDPILSAHRANLTKAGIEQILSRGGINCSYRGDMVEEMLTMLENVNKQVDEAFDILSSRAEDFRASELDRISTAMLREAINKAKAAEDRTGQEDLADHLEFVAHELQHSSNSMLANRCGLGMAVEDFDSRGPLDSDELPEEASV